MDVHKYGQKVPVSEENLQVFEQAQAAWHRYRTASPEQRDEWAAEAARERAAVRAGADVQPVTVQGLLDRMGWSMTYAEHLMRPYCQCGPNGGDGEWERCAHAVDLGIEER